MCDQLVANKQTPQPDEHSSPCFLQEHGCVLQSVLQLQQIISNNDWCAGGQSVRIGSRRPSESLQPQSCGDT